MNKKLSHINEDGDATMVDVSGKKTSARMATASGRVIFPDDVYKELESNQFSNKKGSIFQIAIIAGIQAAKKTSELIPLCHHLALSKVNIDVEPLPESHSLKIECTVKCNDRTGVEMEALTAVTVSALTVYDMCKALSHDIGITEIQLEYKSGGKHDFNRK
ncbi:cyclic pyranopterin monophosphate synthase MoaC [Membranihabitans maritimus]|uniref:cyclic pyranopterin monophosphate synthase MoaC n=1 Tax=Membranihabitans maritimus TaxID=2904244 RepID=UPI001EFFEF8F|nr:cyclic pyranopterin monophosphate synthase MoaC [Membranihabitans maritimus]